MHARFSGSSLAERHRAELRSRRRRAGETLLSLHEDICRLLALAEPNLPVEARDRMGVDYFITALDDPDFKLKMRERAPKSLSDALTIASNIEGYMHDVRERQRAKNAKSDDAYVNTSKMRGKVVRAAGAPGNTGQSMLQKRIDMLEANVDKVLQKLDQLGPGFLDTANLTPIPSALNVQPSVGQKSRANVPSCERKVNPIVCYRCGEMGHLARQCPGSTPDHKANNATSAKSNANIPASGNDTTAAKPAETPLATRGSSKIADRDNVYIQIHLRGKVYLVCWTQSAK